MEINGTELDFMQQFVCFICKVEVTRSHKTNEQQTYLLQRDISRGCLLD